MRKWEFTISARKRGALGVWQRFMPIIEAATQAEAYLKLYDTYEHISLIRVTPITDEQRREQP